MNSGAKKRNAKKDVEQRWVAVSGGFDPLHIGHVRMFKKAKEMGNRLVVIVNNDNWLRLKKGFAFMPEKERAALIAELPYVDKVVLTDHKQDDVDMSVSRTLRKLKPYTFANGGDRKKENTPEDIVCKELGIETVFGIGGGKIQSSSWLIADAAKSMVQTDRPWGSFFDLDGSEGWHLKTITVLPGKRLSLQWHRLRSECWILVDGEVTATVSEGDKSNLVTKKLKKGEPFFIKKRQIHRLQSKKGGTIVEIALGTFNEDDIERIEDDFGRA